MSKILSNVSLIALGLSLVILSSSCNQSLISPLTNEVSSSLDHLKSKSDTKELQSMDSLLPYQITAQVPPKVTVVQTSTSGTYLITVNLSSGARVRPFLASKSPVNPGNQEKRGWSNTFSEATVVDFTSKDLANSTDKIKDASVVVSGSFSNDKGTPAFPVRLNGWTATYGYDPSTDIMMLAINNPEKRAYISNFDLNSFNSSKAPDIVVGLKPSVNKNATGRVGRNFVGLKNPYNTAYGTMVFLVSKHANGITSAKARELLEKEGCISSQIMQLDGSTVAQFSQKVNGAWKHTISESRDMPQAFGIFQ